MTTPNPKVEAICAKLELTPDCDTEAMSNNAVEAATLLREQAEQLAAIQPTIEAYRTALEPFAACVEYIADDEDDEEWAKFRLLIKDYHRARAALSSPTKEGR